MTKKISNMVDANTLDGTEYTEIVQDGISKKTQITNIADFTETQDVNTTSILASADSNAQTLDTAQSVVLTGYIDDNRNRIQTLGFLLFS